MMEYGSCDFGIYIYSDAERTIRVYINVLMTEAFNFVNLKEANVQLVVSRRGEESTVHNLTGEAARNFLRRCAQLRSVAIDYRLEGRISSTSHLLIIYP